MSSHADIRCGKSNFIELEVVVELYFIYLQTESLSLGVRRQRKGEAASPIKRHSAVGVCCDGASWLGPGADAEVRYPSASECADQGPEARETERRVEDARNATHGLKLDQASA